MRPTLSNSVRATQRPSCRPADHPAQQRNHHLSWLPANDRPAAAGAPDSSRHRLESGANCDHWLRRHLRIRPTALGIPLVRVRNSGSNPASPAELPTDPMPPLGPYRQRSSGLWRPAARGKNKGQQVGVKLVGLTGWAVSSHVDETGGPRERCLWRTARALMLYEQRYMPL
jgi:hypothetical protein